MCSTNWKHLGQRPTAAGTGAEYAQPRTGADVQTQQPAPSSRSRKLNAFFDHNIIVSMRHQNWVIKVDYNDGAGTGNILWRLGQGGDFTLHGGTGPTDWQYAQHFPSLFTPDSAGIFSLGLMDNGNDRLFPDGGTCGTGSEPACYTTIPVFQIDEGAKTASITFRQTLPTSLYSFWGGNTELLANGNIEYDLADIGSDSDVFEVTPDPVNPQTVWHMHSTSGNAYRAYRIPSLYPGVQW